MTQSTVELPVGMAGLQYPITQVSLAVRDLDKTMEQYYRAFGWAPWQVFDHVLPVHHRTELRGESVHYSLRGAEVYVGSLNFELLQPLEGPNLWSEFMERRGEGIASIATMFLEREDGDAVKAAFKEAFDIDVIMKADIGDHIEYYYMDTEEQFGCLIESGSGHAIDFVKPAQVYPHPGAEPGPSPSSGMTYPITQVSVTVRDLDAKMRAYHQAFGWGPWKLFEADGERVMYDCEWQGKPARFNVRWAETMVGDLNFELIEPLGPGNPWQAFLDEKGEGISSIAVMFDTRAESDRVKAQFASEGIGVTASARIGDDIEWYFLDTELPFKCIIESGSGHALDDADVPHETFGG
ncbi:MAG: VOC family protein [Thermomicrobiales bacterium]|nr:VOC family protein [Thermomicrobiales bacterium]